MFLIKKKKKREEETIYISFISYLNILTMTRIFTIFPHSWFARLEGHVHLCSLFVSKVRTNVFTSS